MLRQTIFYNYIKILLSGKKLNRLTIQNAKEYVRESHSCVCLTNRFQIAVRLFSNRSQMTWSSCYEIVHPYFPMTPFLGGLSSIWITFIALWTKYFKLLCTNYFNRTEYFNYGLRQSILRAKMNYCCFIISTEVTAFEKQRHDVHFCKIQCSLTNSLCDA